jgi:hypothetical protein
MLLTVLDAVADRVRPIVVLPGDTMPGGLSAALLARGLDVRRCQIPVIRRRYMSPLGLARLWLAAILSLVQLARLARVSGVVAIHTNTSAVLVGPIVATCCGCRMCGTSTRSSMTSAGWGRWSAW